MYRKILLGLILSALVATTATAQSGSKSSGSSSKGSSASNGSATRGDYANTTAAKRKMEREANRQHLKLAKQIAKSDFAPIKLTKDQMESLKESVAANYETITKLDMSIGKLIPADKRKGLKKSFKMSLKEGLTEDKAMSMSMKAVGISEMSQEKVMGFNTEKMDVMASIKESVKASLTSEQTEALAAAMSKKEMMDKDEKMMDKDEKMMAKDDKMMKK